MKEPINPALVRVTGDDMVTGVVTMKEALEREVDKMKPVYDAAMAWMYCDPEFRDIAESNLRVACRQAKEAE